MSKKQSVGDRIVAGLREFRQDLQASPDAIPAKYDMRTVVLDTAPAEFDAARVKEVRKLLGLSQSLFADFLGVSVKTVHAWEAGRNAPQGVACRFMEEIAANPTYWRKRVRQAAVAK